MWSAIAMLTRLDLYNEIWEISVKKVSEKYGVPYTKLNNLCKSNDIPTQTSGYWTKSEFGKSAEKTPLPFPDNKIIDFARACLKKEYSCAI